MAASQLLLLVLRRLFALALLLVVLSFGVFSLLYLAPGSAEQLLLGNRPASPEILDAIREEHHLDEPLLSQYAHWLRGAVTLDFGRSIRTSERVATALADRLGLTLFLGVYGFAVAMFLGVTLGIVAAVKRRTALDRGLVGLSVIGLSAPAFATGVFLLYVFAVELGWFPAFGEGEGFADRFRHLTLPALALALTGMALVVKFTRAGLITALEQDYVAFARARGLSRRRVLLAHGLRNALVPIVTAGGVLLGVMLTGAVLVEVTFALPGLGSLLVEAVTFRDVPVVQALVMVSATLIVLVNLVTDILYVFIDPRIRFDRVGA